MTSVGLEVIRVTPAERLVLQMAADGKTDREIATALGRSFSTVRHQLESELEFDLGDISRELANLGKLGGAGALRCALTFTDVLHHPRPSLALLERAKRFAKACKNSPSGALPAEVATVLYFGFIIVARMRCAARITALDDRSLSRGLEWAIAQPWVDPKTRGLLRSGITYLTENEPGPQNQEQSD